MGRQKPTEFEDQTDLKRSEEPTTSSKQGPTEITNYADHHDPHEMLSEKGEDGQQEEATDLGNCHLRVRGRI